MTNGYYNIQPISVSVGTITASAVAVSFATTYSPFATSMPFGYALYSLDGALLYNGQGVVDETLLSMWGEDDNYIINVMATIAGVTVIW